MNLPKIISSKGDGNELTKQEIDFVVQGINDYVSDYQLSSFLMAIKTKGFTKEELFNYTNALINSGKKMELNEEFVDKHSTGGIGDKTSLIIIPILLSLKIKTFKISGKGLGFTGGTLDKLDSIPNFNYTFSLEEAQEKAHKYGASISGAAKDIVPADSYTYALRDTSGTINSYDLIAASVMSKKIATGAKYILIDLKIGNGAFMETLEEAKILGSKMKWLGEYFKREVFILYSSMNEPLGTSVGNAIEIQEVIDFFQDYKNADSKLKQLAFKITSEFGAKYYEKPIEDVVDEIENNLEKGIIFREFINFIKHQGGETKTLENNTIFKEKYKYKIFADKDGYFFFTDVKNLGYFLIELKAGRKNKNDKLDYHSGVKTKLKNNDQIKKGDLIAEIFSEFELSSGQLENFKKNIYLITKQKGEADKIIISEDSWKNKK